MLHFSNIFHKISGYPGLRKSVQKRPDIWSHESSSGHSLRLNRVSFYSCLGLVFKIICVSFYLRLGMSLQSSGQHCKVIWVLFCIHLGIIVSLFARIHPKTVVRSIALDRKTEQSDFVWTMQTNRIKNGKLNRKLKIVQIKRLKEQKYSKATCFSNAFRSLGSPTSKQN